MGFLPRILKRLPLGKSMRQTMEAILKYGEQAIPLIEKYGNKAGILLAKSGSSIIHALETIGFEAALKEAKRIKP